MSELPGGGNLVRLRPTVESDLADYERWQDPSLPAWKTDGPWFRDDLEPLIRRRRAWLAAGGSAPYSFLEIETIAGIHLGWVSVYLREDDPHLTEFGIDIVEHGYWRRGMGTEAVALWIDYLFREHGLTRLGFSTWDGNPGMLRIGEKLGFVQEARLRRGCEVEGAFHDRIKMGILREEWAARSRDPQAGAGTPAPLPPTSGSIFILYVADQGRSARFYRAVLGRDAVLDVPGMTEFDLGDGARLGLMPEAGIRRLLGAALPDPAAAKDAPRAELYLRRSDAAGAHARALAAGAKELSPMGERDWGERVAYALDPDGHVLACAEVPRRLPRGARGLQ